MGSAAPAIDLEAPQAEWGDQYRDALVQAAEQWMDRGAIVLPVIPVSLPADRWPLAHKGVIRLDKETGEKKPKFPGKAPSYWDQKTGEPQLIPRRKDSPVPTREEVIRQLRSPVMVGAAAEFGSPIGICVLCTPHLVGVDLDVSERNHDLLARCQEKQHYIEVSPRGGLHLFASPADAMASWASSKGFFTNWSLDPDGEHLGEVLSEGKVCLVAPTQRADGACYRRFHASGNEVRQVDDLTSAFGIHPVASKAKRKAAAADRPPRERKTGPTRRSTANSNGGITPHIAELVGAKAEEMLQGNLSAYGDPSEDRSAVLTSFANEAFGTENWLIDEGLAYEGSADELIAQVIDSLGTFDAAGEPIADKADRILDTINRDACDVRDPDKRLSRYKWIQRGKPAPGGASGGGGATPSANPCDAAAQVAAGSQQRPPFVMRGYTPNGVMFLVEETGLETEVRNNQLNKANLMPLASLSWWAERYPKLNNDGDCVGIDWDTAANDLLRLRTESQPYSTELMRGIGVWEDEGRTVVHHGGALTVDGVPTSFGEIRSRFLYVKARPQKGPAPGELTAEDHALLLNLLGRWNFDDSDAPTYILGWIGTSMLSGYLLWRPGLWLTGPTVAGKSSLIDKVVKPLISPIGGLLVSNEATEAGIRQTLGHNALPVVIDEMESDSDSARRRVDRIISMVRGSSSGDGALVVKGTVSGSAINYLVRSSFLFASIDVGLDKAQDRNRTKVLALNPITDAQRAVIAETRALWEQVTPEMGQRLLTRVARLAPTIKYNAEVLETHLQPLRGDQRIAKIEGLLIAAALALGPEGEVPFTEAQGAAVAAKYAKSADSDPAAATGPSDHNDAELCLQHLLMHRITVMQDKGTALTPRRERAEITVQDACKEYLRPGTEIDPDELAREMLRHGLKVAEVQGQLSLLVAYGSHSGAARIFERTSWRNHKETLRRPGADGFTNGKLTTWGSQAIKHRYLSFPLERLFAEEDLPTRKETPPVASMYDPGYVQHLHSRLAG
jgi:putative DNA primase/helicase